MLNQRSVGRSHSDGAWVWAGIVIGFIVEAAVVMLSGAPDNTPRDPKTSGIQTSPIDPKSNGGF
jgi:hypothetical protein